MKSDSDTIKLIPLGDLRYIGNQSDLVLKCQLSPGITRRLQEEPERIVDAPSDFWLQVLTQSIRNRQLAFTTTLPQANNDKQFDVAARTLLQLDGDILSKIDTRLFTRTDAIDTLEVHSHWTNWCLQQLEKALSLPAIIRSLSPNLYRFCWLLFIMGPLLFISGVIFHYPNLQYIGILLLGAGNFIFPHDYMRYLWFLPILPGAISLGLGLHETGTWHTGIWALLSGIVSGPAGYYLARKVFSCVIKRAMTRAFSS